MNIIRIVVALAGVLVSAVALAQEAPKPPTATFVFTEAETKVIADIFIEKRNAAYAEYNKWNDLLATIQKQVERIQEERAKAAAETK